MFESLSARLQAVTQRLRGKARITEADLDKVPAADKPAAAIPNPPDAFRAGQRGAAQRVQRRNLGLPTNKRCVRNNRLRFRIRKPSDARIRTVSIYLNGKRIGTLRRQARLRKPVTIANRRNAFTIRLVAKTTDGRTFEQTRRYTICKRKR